MRCRKATRGDTRGRRLGCGEGRTTESGCELIQGGKDLGPWHATTMAATRGHGDGRT